MSYTWEELLRSWPVTASHPYVNCEPFFPDTAVPFVRVDSFTKQRWYDGLRASEVLAGSLWQAQYLTPLEVKELITRDRLSILCCQGQWICQVEGTIKELMDQRLFNSRNMGALQMLMQYKPAVVPKPVTFPPARCATKAIVYVFFVTTGPQVEHVRCYRGDPSHVTSVINDTQFSWHICARAASADVVVVPSSLSTMWLRMTFGSKAIDFLDPSYYLEQMSSYSVWSFSLHARQIQQVCAKIPVDHIVVAPGDGVGLVARCAKQKHVIVGDMVRDSMTDQLVQTESFKRTMERGQKCAEGRRLPATLVLAYVVSLMTDEERQIAQGWDGPVVVVDSKDVCPFPGFVHIGPGVYSRDFEGVVDYPESMTQIETVLYSENLLSLPAISYITPNPSVDYYSVMRPMAEVDEYRSSASPVIVYHTLTEMFRQPRHLRIGSYLTAVGNKFFEYHPCHLTLYGEFKDRTVYVLAADHFSVPFLKRFSQWAVFQDENYVKCFAFVFQKKVAISFDDSRGWILSVLEKIENEMTPSVLVSRQGCHVVLDTPYGIRKFNVREDSHKYDVRKYCEKYVQLEWEKVWGDERVAWRPQTDYDREKDGRRSAMYLPFIKDHGSMST